MESILGLSAPLEINPETISKPEQNALLLAEQFTQSDAKPAIPLLVFDPKMMFSTKSKKKKGRKSMKKFTDLQERDHSSHKGKLFSNDIFCFFSFDKF